MQVEDVKCGMYQLKAFTTINDIEEFLWDSILSENSLFHSYRFVKVIEDSRVENSRFWYITIYKNGQLITTCCFSAFTMSLDLFLVEPLKNLILFFRKIYLNLLRINVLFCGLPISIGTSNLKIVHTEPDPMILKLIADLMDKIARENSIKYLCLKEFKMDELYFVNGLEQFGYFKARSIPYVKLNVKWKDYSEYLSRLRHSYRRKIKLSLKKINLSNPVIYTSSQIPEHPDFPILIIDEKIPFDPEIFYNMYLNIMARATVKLEMLNKDFFINFFEKMSKDYKILYLKYKKEILGWAIITEQNKIMTFLLIGLPATIDKKYNTYANILYGIVYYGISNGFEILNLGQTAYWLKQQIGGKCEPMYVFLKIRNPILNFIIRSLKEVIFPETKTFNFRTFRDD